MKANEFVENKGLKAAKLIVDCWIDYPETDVYLPDMMEYTFIAIEPTENCPFVSLNDLKRLVESHELVAIHGFEKSKEIVANAPSDDHFYSWTLGDSGVRDKTVNIGKLRKAIADVESCMEVSSEPN